MICPDCREVLAQDARSCSCGWRLGGKAAPSQPTKPSCALCSADAVMRVGADQLCAGHYEARYPTKRVTAGMNYRQRWYAERGLPYQPPKLGDMGGWQCVGRLAKEVEPKSKPEREPGCDDEEVAA